MILLSSFTSRETSAISAVIAFISLRIPPVAANMRMKPTAAEIRPLTMMAPVCLAICASYRAAAKPTATIPATFPAELKTGLYAV